MSSGARTNVLVTQSGGCTPVINRSLAAIVREASEHRVLGNIYGSRHGLDGVLTRDFADLRRLSKASWDRIARTPGAALGSSRRKLQNEDVAPALSALSEHDIGYWFIVGGNDSADAGHTMAIASQAAGYPLKVVNVPKTIDNDLVLTDHTPGYGSAARFVALATMGAGQDARAMWAAAPVTIIEVMGRDSGWLAAAAGLARRSEGDAPHLICVPEVAVDEDRFLGRIDDACRRHGHAVAVVAENCRGTAGVLGGMQEPRYVDDYGHPYHDSPARYLAELVSRRLKVRARYEKPGTIQRSMVTCISRTDAREAEIVGRAAVRYALEGHTDEIVTLVREPGQIYACATGLAPLSEVAGQVKKLPDDYLDPDNDFVTAKFLEYARPLIGPALPRFETVG